MNRRQLYQFVADVPRTERRALLDRCARAMRIVRGLPARRDQHVNRLLDHQPFERLLHDDDALGQIYQALSAPALEAAYRSARRERRKFTDEDIPAVTQLFTPRWVVEFLLHNTLGVLWLEMHPDSCIELPWLVERPTTTREPRLARELRILDPACGTMNFGLVAIELLERMYREELNRAGRSGWPSEPSVAASGEIAPSIVRHNLFGIDIDPVALKLARETLAMKLRIPLTSDALNLRRADALFHPVDHRFDVIVTNPPYLSARNLPKPVVRRLKERFPASWRDACTCFIDRSLDLLASGGGRAGLLVMQSFMFTGSFQRLRERIDDMAAIETTAHFGGGLFDVGNPGTLQTAALVLRREDDADRRGRQTLVAFRLSDVDDKEPALFRREQMHRIEQRELMRSPRRAWTYWLSREVRNIFDTCPWLAHVAPPRQGLATTDNARFVRFWWEVDCAGATPDKWRPYAKGGRFRRWYEAPRHRVDWADDGGAIKRSIVERYPYLKGKWAWVAKNASYYGRAGVTYSYLTSGAFSARRLDAGAIFDVAGSALFPDDPLTMLGILNSTTARTLLGAINPTVNFQIGDLAQLPVPRATDDELRGLVEQAIELQRTLDTFDETTSDFLAPVPWLASEQITHDLNDRLRATESRIDRLVAGLYGVDLADARPVQRPVLDRVDLARRWVSFALRSVLSESTSTPIARTRPAERCLVARLRQCLHSTAGPQAVEQIERTLGGIEEFLERDFFGWHVRLYERRPVLWVLGSGGVEFIVRHDRATRATMSELFNEIGSKLPDGWDRFIDDGIAVNLSPLREWVRDSRLRAWLDRFEGEMRSGRLTWSRTSRLYDRPSRLHLAAVPAPRVAATEVITAPSTRAGVGIAHPPLPAAGASPGARRAET